MSVKHEIHLSLRTPNVLSRLRAVAGSEENLSHYYQLLQQIVNDYHIDVSTSIDESFVRFDLKSRKVIAERNAKSVYQLSCLTGEQLEHITVVSFVSSDGHSFPPLFIFKGNAGVPRAIITAVKQFDGNAQVCITPNGWIDDSSFVKCLTVFLRQLREWQPFEQYGWFLLCLDGHGSHKQLEVAKLCREHKVELLVFPPHCSHIVQPLDLSCFSVLKKGIQKAFCDALSASEVIVRSDVPLLIKPAWQTAFTPENIKGAFRAAGISPLVGLSAVPKDKLSPCLAIEAAAGNSSALLSASSIENPIAEDPTALSLIVHKK